MVFFLVYQESNRRLFTLSLEGFFSFPRLAAIIPLPLSREGQLASHFPFSVFHFPASPKFFRINTGSVDILREGAMPQAVEVVG